MNQYITGTIIKKLREEQGLTQLALANKINVSDKAVSKWETGKGYPDIALLEPISKALNVSVVELLSGFVINNKNRTFNMKKIKFYVCPVCNNIIVSTGEAVISCCGLNLQSLDCEISDSEHDIKIERIEDEYYVSINHDMTKKHYISFIAAVKDNSYDLVKLYPEGPCEATFKINRTSGFYYFCNKDGLFFKKVN